MVEDQYGRVAGVNGRGLSGYAHKCELLLERFTRADGEPWTNAEIEAATDHVVTGSYISALKLGKFKRPGIRQLELIADVVGFPFELWRLDPDLWDEHLIEHPAWGGIRSPRTDQPIPEIPVRLELAVLVNGLFELVPETGGPYTEEDVARKSDGRITAEEIRRMRAGEQLGPPPEIKLIALSRVFRVPCSYWYAPETHEDLVCQEVQAACQNLTRAQKEAVLAFARHVGGQKNGALSRSISDVRTIASGDGALQGAGAGRGGRR